MPQTKIGDDFLHAKTDADAQSRGNPAKFGPVETENMEQHGQSDDGEDVLTNSGDRVSGAGRLWR